MLLESIRIADQLRRALSGDAWHGSPLRDLLADVTADHASAHPVPSAHSIWELVMHIDGWVAAALKAARGGTMPQLFGTDGDWPPDGDNSAAAWAEAKVHLFENAEQLAKAVEAWPDGKLQDPVPGREYDFYHLFHGIIQHSLYHGGQIAMLRKAASAV